VAAHRRRLRALRPEEPAASAQALLEPADVHRDVAAFLAGMPNGGFEGLVLEEATTRDGESATVTLSSIWRPPIVTVFFPDGWRIETTATARAVFG
jgi:hypothetical protein